MCDLFSPLEACRILSCSEVHDEVRWCDWAVSHCPYMMGSGGLTVSDTCIHAVLLVAHPAPQPARNFQSLSLLVALSGSLLASPYSHYRLWQSPQTVPGTEALCKGMSKEKEAFEVQGVGWVPAWVPASLERLAWPTLNPVSQGWELGRVWLAYPWEAEVRSRVRNGLPLFPVSHHLEKLSEVKHRSAF